MSRLLSTVLLACLGPACATAADDPTLFLDGFESYQCNDPLIAPPGWAIQWKSWEEAWRSPTGGSQPTFPNSPYIPVPIGASKGAMLVVPFTMPAALTLELTWDTAYAQPGYLPRPADRMHIAISPCAGDLRAIVPESDDGFLTDRCRAVEGTDALFLRSTGLGACLLETGQRYYMTVAPVDPSDGLSFGEHTCSQVAANSASGCDVQATHRGF